MSDFNWDELPAQAEESKKPKRDTLSREEIPAAILKLAQASVGSGKFHYQPLPHRDMVTDFANFIRAAGDFTEPVSTILAKQVDEWVPPGKDKKVKVTRGAVVRYSAGERRGRKDKGETEPESEPENGENGESAENGENGENGETA
jgi:hypothetical protein